MAFYRDILGWTNVDANGGETIRLTRRKNIYTFTGDQIEEIRTRLSESGFDRIEANGNALLLGVPYLFDAHMHFRDPSGLLPIIGKTSSRLLT